MARLGMTGRLPSTHNIIIAVSCGALKGELIRNVCRDKRCQSGHKPQLGPPERLPCWLARPAAAPPEPQLPPVQMTRPQVVRVGAICICTLRCLQQDVQEASQDRVVVPTLAILMSSAIFISLRAYDAAYTTTAG